MLPLLQAKSFILPPLTASMHASARTYKLLFGFSIFILFIQMWMNTGNMSVYAATLKDPHMMNGYITNYDDLHYEMNYKMMMGVKPKSEWKFSFTLRRIGMFIAGYPFFYIFGFYWGGEITSFLMALVAFIALIVWTKKRFGMMAAYGMMALAGTYTGIMYWIGSPFAHNTIFPATVFTTIIMHRKGMLDTLKKAMVNWLLIGLLFTGYDLFIIFIPAIMLFYLFKRKWKWALLSAVIIFLPQVIVEYSLQAYGALFHNENKDLYGLILDAWFHHFSFPEFWFNIKSLPFIFYHNFLDTGFFILPFIFLIVFIFGRLRYGFRLSYIETCIFSGVFFLWLFLNLCPSYGGIWLLRGTGIARLYQPLFMPMILYIARFIQFLYQEKKIIVISTALIIFYAIILIAVNTGGWYGSTFTQTIYHSFYRHSPEDIYLKNIEYYGKKPLGF
jgi:hypothetical protein